MTPAEAAMVLAAAAAFDRRTIGESDAIAWADALDGLDPAECVAAVRAHYRDTKAWIMPADIRGPIDAQRREAARRRHDMEVFVDLAAAADAFNPEVSHAGYERARAALRVARRRNPGSASTVGPEPTAEAPPDERTDASTG